MKRWAEGDFKADPSLNLIPTLYQKLKSEGHDFSEPTQPKKEIQLSKDPNVVSSQQEEDDIAKAIELSLKETKSMSPKTGSSYNNKTSTNTSTNSSNQQTSSLYPSMNLGSSGGTGATSVPAQEPRKVRALYDFEAAEDNELTFFAGEVLLVLEDTDSNWWKGQNHRGEGLFPSNFVTADLSAEPESVKTEKTNKIVQFSEEQSDNSMNERKEDPVQINEETIDRLLHLLHEADPEDPSQDTDDMLRLEHQVNQMGPLIDAELERVDRKHAQLTQMSSDLADAVSMYHQLMRGDGSFGTGFMSAGLPPHMMYGPGARTGPMSLQNMYNPYQMGPLQSSLPPVSMPHESMMPSIPQQQQFMNAPQHFVAPGMQQPSAFHAPIPQQMQNGHQLAMNGVPNGSQNPGMPPMNNTFMPIQQSQSMQNQMNPQTTNPQFTQASPNHQQPTQAYASPQQPQYNLPPNPNEHHQPSPSHQMHHQQQQQQHIQQQQPQIQQQPMQMIPGQTMLPPGQSMMPPQHSGVPGMIFNQHQNQQVPQNIPIYQQQR